ncbi:RNB-domain-containing protein [Daedaleopsis nitida]|nr:RNB-domain-containing protein [Daedaleopsis nitida]
MRRTAHRLADVSSGLCRASTSRAYSQTAPARGKPRPKYARKSSAPQEQLPVAQELQKVLSPEAVGWLEGKRMLFGKKGKTPSAPSASVVSALTPASPSNEKAMFDAMQAYSEDPTFLDGEDGAFEESQRIPAGSFIEIRRAEINTNCVVLYSILLGRQWIIHALSSGGEIWAASEHDVTFQIPNFINKKLVEQCGMFADVDHESQSAARVEVLKKLRTFEKRLEYDYHLIPEKVRHISLYDLVAHPDPTKWGMVTTREAAEKLLGPQTAYSDQELFAIQSYLFDTEELYVSTARRFLQKQAFMVRPRQEVEDLRLVSRMVLHEDPAIDQFVSKARKVIMEARQRALDSWTEPPTKAPLDGPQWTEKDRAILRFFTASLQNRRIIQTDPYMVPVAQILKKLDMHAVAEYDSRLVHTVLMELGIVAPWEDLNIREGIKQESVVKMDIATAPSTPILPDPLGPSDFYSRDIVDSMRHDFGDTPVYVIDDWDAEELDDGVSVEAIPSDPEHVWLHIHVADPTTLLPPTHNLARQAMQVATASYHVHCTVPMLPREVGFHRFSLGSTPGKPDLVLTFSAKVNSAGEIVDYKVRPAVVRNVRLIKYDEVDALLGEKPLVYRYPFGNPNPPPPLAATSVNETTVENIRLLKKVTHSLTLQRVRNGAATFAFPRVDMSVRPRPMSQELMGSDEPSAFRGFPEVTYAVSEGTELGSRGMVAESMKTAGRVASLFFRDRGIPAVRRTVGPLHVEKRGDLERLMSIRSELGYIDVFESLRARVSAPPGKYMLTPGAHSLMGIPEGEGYAKVTSPLRRFIDLMAHWQIKHALLAEKGEAASPILFEEDWLLRAAEEIEGRELEEKRTENRQQQFWAHSYLLRWMQDPAREKREHDPLRSLKGRITDGPYQHPRTHGLLCSLHVPEIALDARISRWPSDLKAGFADEVEVEIQSVLLSTHPLLYLQIRR